MSALPPNFLSKKGRQWRPVNSLDLAILTYSVAQASSDPTIGFDDANETTSSAIKKLTRSALIDPNLIESGLWAANMLNEAGKFSHPLGYTFEYFVKSILGDRGTFDPVYNIITWKTKGESK